MGAPCATRSCGREDGVSGNSSQQTRTIPRSARAGSTWLPADALLLARAGVAHDLLTDDTVLPGRRLLRVARKFSGVASMAPVNPSRWHGASTVVLLCAAAFTLAAVPTAGQAPATVYPIDAAPLALHPSIRRADLLIADIHGKLLDGAIRGWYWVTIRTARVPADPR